MPILLSKLIAKTFRIFPNPPITEDQLRLLSYNNVATKKYKTNFDIGVPSISMFNQEVESYCYMWKDQGQFSTKKYNNKN